MTIVTVYPDTKKLCIESNTGPAADVSVATVAAADVDIAIKAAEARILRGIGLVSIAGIPDGIVLVQFDINTSRVRLRVFNHTAAAITILAKSLTVAYTYIGY